MKWFVIKAPEIKFPDGRIYKKGWGNGYIALPPQHAAWGMHYDDVNKHVNVHYGFTFSDIIQEDSAIFKQHAPVGWWVFGFDTSHYDDDEVKWNKEAVEAETKRIFIQLMEFELGES